MVDTNTDMPGLLSELDVNIRMDEDNETRAQNQQTTTYPTNMEPLSADKDFDEYVLLLIDATSHLVCKTLLNPCLHNAE